jgi:trans-aconitate methyltransferase
MGQTWTAAGYERNGRFVADSAGEVFGMLDAKPGERVLDLGCGDGGLSHRIQDLGATVLGVDTSPELLASARSRGLDVQLCSGEQLNFRQEFDAVFSNAALHWMLDQGAMLKGVHSALKPGGRFVAEMGGHGNIATIRAALSVALEPFGIDAEAVGANVFFTAAEYSELLRQHDFQVEVLSLVARQTPLPTGIDGWLRTFRRSLLDELSVDDQEAVILRVSKLLKPILCDRSGQWFADYVRLRFRAFSV